MTDSKSRNRRTSQGSRTSKRISSRDKVIKRLTQDSEGRAHLAQVVKALIRMDKWKRRPDSKS